MGIEERLSQLEKGRPNSFRAGVIGVGDLGRHVVRALVDLKNEGIGLQDICISDINTTESYLKASVLSEFFEDEIRVPKIYYSQYTLEGIQELKENTNIIFVTAGREFNDKSGEKTEEYGNKLKFYNKLQSINGLNPITDYRILKGLPYNLDIIKNLADWFSQGEPYHGHVVIATNPPDILTYVFKLYSGLGNQVSGFDHMETIRLQRNILSPLVIVRKSGREETYEAVRNNGICIGDHGGGSVPIFSHLEFPNGFTFDMLKPECYSQILANLRKYISEIRETNEDYKERLKELDEWLNNKEREFSQPQTDKEHVIKDVVRQFLSNFALIVRGLSRGDPPLIREEAYLGAKEHIEQIFNGDYLVAASLCGKLTDILMGTEKSSEIEAIIEKNQKPICMGYFAGYSWFKGSAPLVQGVTQELDPWEAKYFAQRFQIISVILQALKSQGAIMDKDVPVDVIGRSDIKEEISNAPTVFKKLYEGPTQGKQKPIVIQINGTPIGILQKLAGLDEIPSELRIESHTRTTKDNSERIAKFDSLYEKVEQMLYDVPKNYSVTDIGHLTKLAQAAKDLLNYVAQEGYVDESQRDRMKTLDTKLNELKDHDAAEIRKILFKGNAWDKILQELNDDKELIQEWIDYTKKWLNTKFASPERKKLEVNPKYQRAVALQRKYHPLLGQSRANIENNFEGTEETQKALELYKQVCGIWC